MRTAWSEVWETGIPGLDEVLGGGIPRGSMVLIAGTTGTGKTVLVSQVAYNLASRGVRSLVVSFDEGRFLLDYRASFGWDARTLEERGVLRILDLDSFSLKPPDIVSHITGVSEEMGASLIIIDSLSTLIMGAPSLGDSRALLDFLRRARPGDSTLLCTANIRLGSRRIGVGVEEIAADGLILLRGYLYRGERRTKLSVIKLRGMPHSRRQYQLLIDEEGVSVLPFT